MIDFRPRRLTSITLFTLAAWFGGIAGALIQPAGVMAQPIPPVTPPMMWTSSNIYAQGPRGPVDIMSTADGLTLPSSPTGPGFSSRSGLQLSVKSSWPGQYGYHPLQITVRSLTPATSDVALVFRFTGGTGGLSSNGVSARQAFTLPQGQSSVTIKLLVPQLNYWNSCQWELRVDGTRDDTFTIKYIDVSGFRGQFANNAGDVAAVGVMLSDSQANRATADLSLAFSNATPILHRVDPKELPTDWIAYTSLNVVIIPAASLDKLVNDHPKQAAALLRWVATGGNLWLVGAGRRWQELADVEQALSANEDLTAQNLSAAESAGGSSSDSPDDLLPPNWRFAPINLRATEPAEGAVVLANFTVDEAAVAKANAERRRRRSEERQPAPAETVVDQALPRRIEELPKSSAEWFAIRGWGLGAVTAFRKELRSANERANQDATQILSQSLLATRQLWAGRFGSVPDDANVDFNDWLIPGVGLAPVGSFQVLITLFVLAIGPFTYWILRRTGKLPMLVAIVPAAAIVTTLALFAYGIVVDGVSARVRGRSVTLLDQETGECASWGRYSYYAGIAPRDGIVVPLDQAMFPIMPNWSAVFGFGGEQPLVEREVVWDDQQHLTRGWLPSRTPTQYHALAARKSPKKLDLRATAEGMRVTNRLGVEIVGVAIQDHDNKFYWCEALPNDKGVVIQAVEQPAAASQIRRLFTENLPELPLGDDGRRSGRYYSSYSVSDSMMEGRLSAINAPQLTGWGPGRYIAFTKTAIELTPGLEDVDEQRSFHVIEGSWPR